MRNYKKTKTAALLALMLAAQAGWAQSLWTSAGAKLPFANGWNATIEGENRTKDGLDGSERWSAGLSVGYKVTPWLRASAGYTYIYQHTDSRTTKKGNIVAGYWQPRHRAAFSLTGSYKWERLTLSLRERYQYTHHTSLDVAKVDGDDGSKKEDEHIEAKDRHSLRSRLQAEYNIKKCPLTPYASAEIYNDLAGGFQTEKMRYTVGLEYDISKHHVLNAFYRYIDRTDDDDADNHVVGIGYQYKF